MRSTPEQAVRPSQLSDLNRSSALTSAETHRSSCITLRLLSGYSCVQPR
jgi:hypothetical protein